MSLVTSIKNQNLDRLINAHLQNYLVVVLSGLLVLQSYVFLSVESATGYETSIVTAMPLEYWILFYSVLAGGIVTLIAAAVTRSSYWKHGIGIVLANYLFYFTLPKTRGYKLWGRGIADLLQHLGYVKEIINTGALPGTWYPGEHVLMAELTMLGVPFEGISYLTLFLFTAIQIVAIGALVRMFTEKRGSLAVGLAAGVPLVYTELHLSLHPALTSFMMVPALLLVVERYRRSGKNGYLLLYALFCLFFVYTHPMTTLFVFGLLLAVAVYARFNDWLTDTNTPSLSPRLAVVLLPMLFIWLINFRQTRLEVRKVFAPTDEKPPGTAEIQEATEISFTVLELAKKFLHLYGAPFFYLCTAGLFALFVVIAFRRGVKRYDWHLCVLQFGAGLGIAFVFLQNNLIVDTPIRAARYAMLFAAILVGLVTVHSIQRSDLKLTAVLTVIIVLTAALAANGAYEPNRHLTYTEYDGTHHMATQHELGLDIHSFKVSRKQEAFAIGTSHPRLWPSNFKVEYGIPDNLGYEDGGSTAGETFGRSYIVTKTYDLKKDTAVYYTEEQRSLIEPYDRQHRETLTEDSTANKVYENGGFTGWLVSPTS